MVQYINKATVVAEIDGWRDGIRKGILSIPLTGSDKAYATFEYEILGKVRDFLDTLEVKEVDLEKAARYYLLHKHISPLNEIFHQAELKAEMQYHKDIENSFKAGFELGLKTKGE